MIAGIIIGIMIGISFGITFSAWCQTLRDQDDIAQGFTILNGDLYKIIKYSGGSGDEK